MDLLTRLTSSLKDVRGRGQRLVQLNVELLKAEFKAKGEKYGVAVGMFFAAGLLALYALGFALATVAVTLHLVLPLWLSLLVVTVGLLLLVLLLVFIGRDRLLRAGSPAPDKAIAEARASIAVAKTQLTRSGRGTVSTVAGAEAVPSRQSPPHAPTGRTKPHPGVGDGEEAPGTATSDATGPARGEGRRL